MGKERQTTKGTTAQTTAYTPTAEEQEFNRLALAREKAAQPGLLQTQAGGLNLINLLLAGQALPGYLQGLPGGISPEAIGTQASRLAGQYGAGFQGLGILDSGTAFRETARGIANELLFPAEQFNLQNLIQLLNLAVGGQVQVQQPLLAQSGMLAQQLAGLRGISQAGTQAQTVTMMNPFLRSFQQSLGQGLGTGVSGGVRGGAGAMLRTMGG